MLCRELHQENEGCAQEMGAGELWKYCPRCGRSTGHIALPEGRFSVPFATPVTQQFALRNTGLRAVSVSLELLSETKGLDFVEDQPRSFTVAPRLMKPVQISVPPLTQPAPQLGYLLLEADDAPLDSEGDPWQARERRRFRVPLHADVETPAQVRAVQELALFRESVPERVIEIENTGRTSAEIVEVRCPLGYETGDTWGKVPGGSRFPIRVRRNWSLPAETLSPLIVRMEDGLEFAVNLHCAPISESRELHRAVIGIDFGTAFTSVSFRECRHHPELDDEVSFLRPVGEEADRFPTRLWVGRNGDFQFGTRAGVRYEEDPSPDSGFLFREIKTLLRDRSRLFVHPETHTQTALQYVTDRFGEAWPQRLVTEYLQWMFRNLIQPELRKRFQTTDARVRYVFSLPVLDFSPDTDAPTPQYDAQRQRMEQCIRQAGFPMEMVEFQFEPVCAALSLLTPPPGVSWPRLGGGEFPIQNGDGIVVFDSGGGTTDVALARAELDGDHGKLTLLVERCVGVGSGKETFGGELITTRMLMAFANPSTVEGSTDWYRGEGVNFDIVLGNGQRADRINDLELRDRAEALKTELALSLDKGVRRGGTMLFPKLLGKLVLPYLSSLAKELRERMFAGKSPADTRYYLCVGGNTYLSVLQLWIENFMGDDAPKFSGRRLRVPEEYRKLAISYGAAWVPDARIRNAVPYDLQIVVEQPTPLPVLLTFRRNTSQETYGKSAQYQLPPRGSLDFRLIATIEEKKYCVGSASVTNPHDATTILDTLTDVQNGVIRIAAALHDPRHPAAQEERRLLLKYPL